MTADHRARLQDQKDVTLKALADAVERVASFDRAEGAPDTTEWLTVPEIR